MPNQIETLLLQRTQLVKHLSDLASIFLFKSLTFY